MVHVQLVSDGDDLTRRQCTRDLGTQRMGHCLGLCGFGLVGVGGKSFGISCFIQAFHFSIELNVPWQIC